MADNTCSTRNCPPRKQRQGFTLIELLVVVAILSLLISILLPSLQKARDLARLAVCSTRLKGIGVGYAMYTQDYSDTLPAFLMDTTPLNASSVSSNWWQYKHVLAPYLGLCSLEEALDPAKNLSALRILHADSPFQAYVCPAGAMASGPIIVGGSDPEGKATNYYFQNGLWDFVWAELARLGILSWTRYHAPLAKFEHSSDAMLLYDNWQIWIYGMIGNSLYGTKPYNAHSLGEKNHGRNVLYVDGHVEFLDAENDMIWSIQGGTADYIPEFKWFRAY